MLVLLAECVEEESALAYAALHQLVRPFTPACDTVNRTVASTIDQSAAMSAAAMQIIGPGLGGWLVQLVGAPLAVVVDAVSFAFDALDSIRLPEPPPSGAREGGSLRREIAEGLRWLFERRALLPGDLVWDPSLWERMRWPPQASS